MPVRPDRLKPLEGFFRMGMKVLVHQVEHLPDDSIAQRVEDPELVRSASEPGRSIGGQGGGVSRRETPGPVVSSNCWSIPNTASR